MQEQQRIVQEQQREIAALQQENVALRQENAGVVATLAARLAALETKASGKVTGRVAAPARGDRALGWRPRLPHLRPPSRYTPHPPTPTTYTNVSQ